MDESAGAAHITRLLHEWRNGSQEAFDRLVPLVYSELRALASRQLTREWRHDRLQITAIVSEAYLKLFHQREVDWQNRGHFFAIAAQLMRRILIDHARAQQAAKRPAAEMKVTLDDRIGQAESTDCDLLLLNQALSELAAFDPRQGQIVELRYFGGLAEHEVAEVLAISRSTVTREWQTAKAWLYRRMTSGSVRP